MLKKGNNMIFFRSVILKVKYVSDVKCRLFYPDFSNWWKRSGPIVEGIMVKDVKHILDLLLLLFGLLITFELVLWKTSLKDVSSFYWESIIFLSKKAFLYWRFLVINVNFKIDVFIFLLYSSSNNLSLFLEDYRGINIL